MILRALFIPLVAMAAGALGGGVFRDPYAGPIIGGFIGLGVGLIVMALALPFRSWRKDASRPAAGKIAVLVLSALLALGATKLMYAPPAALLFNRVVMTPRPLSVSDLRAHVEYTGRRAAYALAFRIDRADLDPIIKRHGLDRIDGDALPDGPLLNHPPTWWWSPESAAGVEVYLLADRYNEAYEAIDPVDRLLLYDPATHQARFLLADFIDKPDDEER